MNQKGTYFLRRGHAQPLGSTRQAVGVNFSFYAKEAENLTLLLFTPGQDHPFLEVLLDPIIHRTGDIWHVLIENLPKEVEYVYRIEPNSSLPKWALFDKKHLLLDPYAKLVNTPHLWGDVHVSEKTYSPRGKIVSDINFDWEDVLSPKIAKKDLIIYEMHVRGFTQHSSSRAKHPGTFLGVIEKIPYLKELGVNAVELLPIFEFNECENSLISPVTKKHLYNYWGYSTVNFFSPMNRYSSSNEWRAALIEFKTMVKELHRNNIEVILDVVYNHTSENGKQGPIYSFKGIENSTYYMLNSEGDYYNFSGTGNTFNCNHPIVIQLIVDSLRYWVSEMHVDGFRFDLASILTRDSDGTPLAKPPVVQMIHNDPILSETKLIAEAWDAGGLYQVGTFPGEGCWAEWNGIYRDSVRRFIKGTDEQAGAFAQALCGSQNVYGKDRKPFHSINFVTAHDGYSLNDLVSYQDKHNLDNGEENRDGANQNDSWNCGAEGHTINKDILHLRERQYKNFLVALLLSVGTPMLLMGDEYGHTRKGNNNPYCHDDELNWFLWDELEKHKQHLDFCKKLIKFRKDNSRIFCREEFLTPSDVEWHGHLPSHPDWSAKSRFVAYTLKDPERRHSLFIAYNSHFEPCDVILPPPPPSRHWHLVLDTAHYPPYDFVDLPQKHHPAKNRVKMLPHSALILQAH